MTHPDFAEILQARIRADLEAERIAHTLRNRPDSDERLAPEADIFTLEEAVANTEALGEQQRQEAGTAAKLEALEAHIATLENAVARAQALGEQRGQEAETAAKRVEALEAHIATLENAIARAEALGEQRRQEAETAAKRVEALEAEIGQAAIGIKLTIMMDESHITGLDVKRLQRIADSLAGLRTAS